MKWSELVAAGIPGARPIPMVPLTDLQAAERTIEALDREIAELRQENRQLRHEVEDLGAQCRFWRLSWTPPGAPAVRDPDDAPVACRAITGAVTAIAAVRERVTEASAAVNALGLPPEDREALLAAITRIPKPLRELRSHLNELQRERTVLRQELLQTLTQTMRAS